MLKTPDSETESDVSDWYATLHYKEGLCHQCRAGQHGIFLYHDEIVHIKL